MGSCSSTQIRSKNDVSCQKFKKPKNAIIEVKSWENKDSEDYFETNITLEKSSVFTKDGSASSKNNTWTTLEKNDDSSDMPKQPSGRKYNSLLCYEANHTGTESLQIDFKEGYKGNEFKKVTW